MAALIARYWFALLMVLIVIRAWRMTITDNRRARTLRAIATSTGQLGELVVIKGSGKARRGMKYPILQEGMIGSSGRADIRIRAASVAKKHAHFRLQSDGLLLTSIGGAPLAFTDGKSGKKLLAGDGDSLVIGSVTLLCVLFDGQSDQVHERVSAPAPKLPDRYDELDDFAPGAGRPDPLDVYDMLDDPFAVESDRTGARPRSSSAKKRPKRR